GYHATSQNIPREAPATVVGRLTRLGPEPTATKKSVATAVQKWTDWWDKHDPNLAQLKSTPPPADDAAPSPGRTASNSTPPPSDAPEDPAAKAEREAAVKLRLAQMLEKDGVVDKAKTRYQDIIDTYPKTKAADEARKLLQKLKKK